MRRFILKLFRRRRLERDLEAELAFHREMAERGGNPTPFGNEAVIRERAYDQWRFNFIENLWRDVVYGVRALRRNPALVFGALLSLALGIGVNTMMFSLGVEFMFSEPSVRDSSSLVALRMGGSSHAEKGTIEFIRESGIFADVVGQYEEGFINWNDGTETRRLFGFATSKNFFTVLGIPMALGRGYQPSDPDQVAVIHDHFWRRHFNSDPNVLGRPITLEGRAYTIVGVLPRNHRTLVGFGFAPDVFVPSHSEDNRLAMYARLKEGMDFDEAYAAYRTVGARLDSIRKGPSWASNSHEMDAVGGVHRLNRKMLTLGVFFIALQVVVGLVLLIACINVAGLLLARASARRREFAIRLSLGAGRGRLMQQLLIESLLLSIGGTALGFMLAQVAANLVAGIQLPLPVPIRLQIDPDWRVVTYAALLAVFSTVACGMLPAWQTVRESISTNLHSENRFRMRRALVATQIAVSVIVLATGFLFVRNLLQSNALSPGFDVQHTVRADVHLPREKYRDAGSIRLFVERAVDSIKAIPGVEAAAGARLLPFTDGNSNGTDITFPETGEKRHIEFSYNAVTPEFFHAMEIPILRGRAFSSTDRGQLKVVAVNSTFAERFLADREPVGSTFLWGGNGETPLQVVAVVGGTKTMTIGEEQRPQLYEPFSQVETDRMRVQFVARTATPPATQLSAMKRALRDVEPNAGIEVETLYSSIGMAFLPSQIGAALLGSVGLLGLLLAGVGLYGTMLYSVARRTREIGVRMAIGATRGDIMRMVLKESARLIVIGSAFGLFTAIFVTKPLAMFLVPGLRTSDPLSLMAVVVVLGATGLVASWGPVRRALRIDPMTSLRYE